MIVSFGKKIILGFALSISVFAVIALASYMSGLRFEESSRQIAHTHEVIECVEQVLSDLKDAETGARGFVITKNESFLEPYNSACADIPPHFARLRTLIAGNNSQSARADSLSALADAKLKRLAGAIALRRTLPADSSFGRLNFAGKKIMDDARRIVKNWKALELASLETRQKELKNYESLNGLVNTIGLLGALSLFIALYLILRAEIRRRNKAEGELLKSNSFLGAILENIPNMIFVKDAEHLRFVRLNKAGEKLLGVSRDALTGKTDYDFFPKEQADFFTSKDRAVLKDGSLQQIQEEPIQTPQGERWLHTQKIPLLDEKGKPAFLLGISQDITESRLQQEAIRQLNRELEAFSYSVSHDLRGPLNGMNRITTLLEREYGSRLDEEGLRLLGMLRTSSSSLSELIRDLLAFAKVGKHELVKEQVDMEELVRKALEDAKAFFPGCKPLVTIGPLHPVMGDKSMLCVVLVNLLSNAIKFSAQNPEPHIEIGSASDKTGLSYFVKDNGAGFDMKYSGKLFSVFQRLHEQDEFDGTGVGLAIVDRIITKHGGRVWAEGKVGAGATFSFALPS